MNMRLWIAAVALMSGAAFASEDVMHPRQIQWPFDGITGKVDKMSAQRGFQVYKEVCAACHGLNRVAFRSLADLGFSEGEIKALAATYQVGDGPNDAGDMFQRPGRPSDRFVAPFANEQAARATNNGAYPPDLSLIVKARADGANYVHSILTGYAEPPADFKLNDGMHYNPYFPGRQIAMPNPLSEGQVTFEDGTKASVDQMSRDVVSFLQWAAEPEMEKRKGMGIKVFIYLAIFTAFMWVAKKRIWSRIDH